MDAPEEITQYLLAHNQKHFGQAAGTPFTVPPLRHHVDFSASTESCELILEGTYNTETLQDLTRLLVAHMKKKIPLNILPASITE